MEDKGKCLKYNYTMDEKEIRDWNVKNAYLRGLEKYFRNQARKLFEQGASTEDVHRKITELRHQNEKWRQLNDEEKKLLKTLDKDLRKECYMALMHGASLTKIQKLIKERQHQRAVCNIKKETVLQMEKTITQLQKLKKQIPMSYFEVMFDLDIFNEGKSTEEEYSILAKMGLIMLSTYDKNGKGEYYSKVRAFMFDKIGEAFERGIIPHPLMFEFMFKGDWISENTFMVLHLHADELIERGLSGMLALPLERMYEKRKKDEDPQHPFSKREEHYFISLINLFKKK